jgi:Mlc titration factor MtfA (ptsG expression regulator)
MRHIDLRLAWVRVLRESGLITCVHVDTKNQLADIFTKLLDQKTFIAIRDKLMHYCPG